MGERRSRPGFGGTSETVRSRGRDGALYATCSGKIIAEGRYCIVSAQVRKVFMRREMNRIEPGDACQRYDRPGSKLIMKSGGDCHQPWRAHLSRGDYRPRIGYSAVVGCGDATERMKDGESKSSPLAQKVIPVMCMPTC